MELPIIAFIQETLREADAELETREGSAWYDMFVKPQQLLTQPIQDAVAQGRYAQSVRLIRGLPDPNAFSEEDVDSLAGNIYVDRAQGAIAETTVRVYYTEPLDKEVPARTAEYQVGDLTFLNKNDIVISAADMALQTDGALYYIDVPVVAEAEGSDYNVAAGEIVAAGNDADAVRVTNFSPAIGGLARETNVQLLDRIPNSIGVRDLETEKGINAILREKFPYLQRIKSIGLGDPEMMRDILFNTHVGGKTDVYLKTPEIAEGSTDVIGLDYDLTRTLSRNIHLEMARSEEDSDYSADVGTREIVVNSVVVREAVDETEATLLTIPVPPGVGIDLTGKEWLRFEVDALGEVQVKITGTNPAQTQRHEILSAINTAVGRTVARLAPANKIRISGVAKGAPARVRVYAPTNPVSSANNAAEVLFGSATLDVRGVVAAQYLGGIDYEVSPSTGRIFQKTFNALTRNPGGVGTRQTITSGQTMLSAETDGAIVQDGSVWYFDAIGAPANNKFLLPPMVLVRPGDRLIIEEINNATTGTVIGDLPQTVFVGDVVSGSRLKLSNFESTASATNVKYSIVSEQVVVVDYQYHPLSIDIGDRVIQADGFTRGIRPGRDAFTIKDVPLLDITSIQEIDPDSGDLIGEPLAPPVGFGGGGYGEGGFGQGMGGDYDLLINSPPDRFSRFDDAIILFRPEALSKSYRISYRWVPEIRAIHDVCRNDLERVTGADVLPKNLIPIYVDIAIVVRRNPTNLSTPPNEDLASLVADFIHTVVPTPGLEASDIIDLLEAQGVRSVETPFLMQGTVHNTDGSTRVLESEDILAFPIEDIERETTNYTTQRITQFYPGVITVVDN
jgi:hypothetical protein